MQRRGMWLPIVASIGVGAAAFYSMTKGRGMGSTMKQMVPFVADMNNPNMQQQSTQQPINQQQ